MTARFEIRQTPLAGLQLLRRLRLGDERGFLTRLFCAEELLAAGWDGPVAQINETGTGLRGTVRGLHFQHPPHGEVKLVTCTAGAVLDVAVDLREGSATFLKHFAVELSADNACSLLIPQGFAHGFQTLTDDVRMIYAHSAPFNAEAEGGLSCRDPAIGIDWPLPIVNLSARDAAHPKIADDYRGLAA
ncbi:dTDP-4-dehydrorhamnose 3,5-epimerase family protein [Rhizobium halophytocola]|uniref:dTDP-4-dehydrorhamnose 3,5-epimerase n=1 Tax=Rhizobium halophytocola TaxID=735519 RepID=A0ABS4E0P2_9HYPH|nr:dTDP-4-dehydrorhamnose 3,5-epimerase [Rhizobium halophytocola]MBP1851508.1 dTDP-4-dehydrorhamnose 3,5-epimerase [Rhizobium halophytocola]